MTRRYKTDESRDAAAFNILQNMPPQIAQSFFWNFRSRAERREAILAWKAEQDMNTQVYQESKP